MAAFERIECGIPSLDSVFDNIRLGDNVVWQLTTLSDYINRITVPSRVETTRSVIGVGKIREYKDLHRQIFNIVTNRDKASIEAVIRNHYIFWEKYR